MKPRLTRKAMLLATLCCIVLTLAELLKAGVSPINIINHRDFKVVIYWIVLIIGWAVYFLDLIRAGRKKDENDEKTS